MFQSQKPSYDDLPTTKQLIQSTIIAFIVAMGILVTIVLPSEYGVDPTGAGELLGLKSMGNIKTSLAAEQKAEQQRNQQAAGEIICKNSVSEQSTPKVAVKNVVQKTEKKAAPSTTAATISNQDNGMLRDPASELPEGEIVEKKTVNHIEKKATAQSNTVKSDQFEYTLKPGAAIELKLAMNRGAVVDYEWSTKNGHLNHDTHGDGPGKKFISYKRGRAVTGDKGKLKASFNGSHGWFWRNRDRKAVTVKLKVSGSYLSYKRVM